MQKGKIQVTKLSEVVYNWFYANDIDPITYRWTKAAPDGQKRMRWLKANLRGIDRSMVRVCLDQQDIVIGIMIPYASTPQREDTVRKEPIIITANKLADYHWKAIQTNFPAKFQGMKQDIQSFGNQIAFGFNEQLEPVCCYVAYAGADAPAA